MLTQETVLLRKSTERGHTVMDWLDSHHTFSFSDYHDPNFMHFGVMRVLNEDRVSPSGGFGSHGHKDMEIVSVVIDGNLEHKDNIGNGSIIKPGDVQRMSAGTGIIHSEFNPSTDAPVHFLQLWFFPKNKETAPEYEQKHFPLASLQNHLTLIASPDGADGSLTIHQDVLLYRSILEANQPIHYTLTPERMAWLQVMRGDITVAGITLSQGDGLGLQESKLYSLSTTHLADVLIIDMARSE